MAWLERSNDEIFATWAVSMMPHVDHVQDFEPYTAVGVMREVKGKPKMMAAVIYHSWVEKYRTCQISASAVDPRWASKETLRAVLSIPFLEFGCHKVWTATPHKNERVIGFNRAIGFEQEAVLKDQYGPGSHAVICRMFDRYYRRRYIPLEWQEAA